MNESGSQQSSTQELIGAVRELISLMGKGGISELDLTSGDVSIRLRGAATSAAPASPTTTPNGEGSSGTAPENEGHVVTAPMIGTFYSAPSPGEDPFVQIGDEVEVGQVIGIIEAMKIMNEIVADKPGVVAEILVENAQAVEYGSPLVRLTEQTDAL
ncbi:MAG TPA: acetyl-CoA carboxylase biotin carboxyl carrier protein [Thermomicrobiales bacterium]|nr:acetyl-CoA carboxylase biotin carboxyl carrier protein [Thermomicrobiales bacterium]